MRQTEFNELMRGYYRHYRRDNKMKVSCVHTKAELTLYRICVSLTLGVLVAFFVQHWR